MSNVEKISVSLPREMIDYMKESIERGLYASTSEILREAVRDWQRKEIVRRHDALTPKSHEDLRRMIQEGVDSLKKRRIPAEEVYAELTARYGGKGKGKRSA
jgi:antitoxin ParD1/3/4